MANLDGRSAEARLIKARNDRKAIFRATKECRVKIKKVEFQEAFESANTYYLWKYVDSDEPFTYLTKNAFIHYLRHQYTNYDEYLEILRQLDGIPFTYRLRLGLIQETKAHEWLKRRFNRIIEKVFNNLLKKFDEKQM